MWLPLKGALERLRSLPLPTREDFTIAFVSLMRVLLWLPGRLLHVFLGTYMSRNSDVRRAALVADINAWGLAVAVILLLTSRATFNQAEETIKHRAWANLILDSSGDACATLNQNPFMGSNSSHFHFYCEDARHGNGPHVTGRTTLPLNASNQNQVMAFLKGIHEDCDAFSMAIEYTAKHTAVCYEGNISKVLFHEGEVHEFAEGQGVYRWKSLDWVHPTDRSACANSFEAGRLQTAIDDGACFFPGNASKDTAMFPNDLGFPLGMDVVRWLDEVNKGIFLGVKCNGQDDAGRSALVHCISSSETVHNATGQWEAGGSTNATLKGPQEGAFCAPNGTLSLRSFPVPYRCSDGAQSSSIHMLNDESDALKAVQRFAYFRCLSYDELYAVYVGIIGVLIAVSLTTTTLFFTDVARPMFIAGREDWSWDMSRQRIGVEDSVRHYTREKNMLDVFLRCAAALAVGSVLGMGCVYAPWRAFLDKQGQECSAA